MSNPTIIKVVLGDRPVRVIVMNVIAMDGKPVRVLITPDNVREIAAVSDEIGVPLTEVEIAV